MYLRRIKDVILRMVQLYRQPYFQGAGAQLAFYLVMSLVPLTVLFAQVCAIFAISPETIGEVIETYLSPQAVELMGRMMPKILHSSERSGSGAFSIVAVWITLWAASKVQFCIAGICNYANSGTTRVRGFVRERIRALINVALLILMVVASLVGLVYGQVIMNVVGRVVTEILGLPFRFNDIWYLIRWPVSIAVYAVILSYIYYSSPAEKPRFRQVLPGGVFAAVGMMIVSLGYSVYVTTFANYDALYGSLASVVVMLFWFYLLGTIFVLGILFNQVWNKFN